MSSTPDPDNPNRKEQTVTTRSTASERSRITEKVRVRTWHSARDEVLHDGERPSTEPLTRVAVAATINNPYAGVWSDSLELLEEAGGVLARVLMERCQELLGNPVQAYGKGGIVGENGELEHVAAVLHPRFGGPTRELAEGLSILPSVKKRGGPGSSLDIPVHHRTALLVRSHFDAMEVCVPDSPHRDELLIVLAVTDGPRPHSRVGGLTVEEMVGEDGLN